MGLTRGFEYCIIAQNMAVEAQRPEVIESHQAVGVSADITPRPSGRGDLSHNSNILSGWREVAVGTGIVVVLAGGAGVVKGQEPSPSIDPFASPAATDVIIGEADPTCPPGTAPIPVEPSLSPSPEVSPTPVIAMNPYREMSAINSDGSKVVVTFDQDASAAPASPAASAGATEGPITGVVDVECKDADIVLRDIMQGIMDQEKEDIKDVKTGPLRNQAMQYLTDHPDILGKFKSGWDSSPINEKSLRNLLDYMVDGAPGAIDLDISRSNGAADLSTLFAAVSIEALRQGKTEESELAFKIGDRFYDWGVSNIKLAGIRDQLATDISISIIFHSQTLRSISIS